jgi:Concanavalin A-like lectin/glucanases superfamily
MKPAFFPVIMGGRRGSVATVFSPASLFTSGVVGAWYDPSDYTSLFQDSAGTTAVTAVEQPVGLMLDKSQGLVLGADIQNGGFDSDTAWTKNGWVIAAGVATSSVTAAITQISPVTLAVGDWVKVTVTVSAITSGFVYAWVAGDGNNAYRTNAVGTYTWYFQITAVTNQQVGIYTANAPSGIVIDNVSIRRISGNHALQATSASRPILRARYNLLTYSEQFNTGWSLNAAAVTANQEVAPDGTTTADKIANSTTTSDYPLVYQAYTLSAAATVTQTVYAKVGSANFLSMATYDGTVVKFSGFNLSNGTVNLTAVGHTLAIVDAGGGWYRCSVTYAYPATTARVYVGVYKTSGTPSYVPSSIGADFIYSWGADARYGSSAGTYQRIAAATDYDTVGFLPYLAFDGTDDSFATGSIDFSATDKMSVCAGVTKLTSADGIVSELSADLSVNNGAFYLFLYSDTAYYFGSRGTIQVQVASSALAAPRTNTLTGLGDISGDLVTLRVNGAQVAQSTSNQGTGNYGNYPLYVGRRGGSTLPFNGRIYQMVVCGKTLSASELASTEAYVNTKTGAY